MTIITKMHGTMNINKNQLIWFTSFLWRIDFGTSCLSVCLSVCVLYQATDRPTGTAVILYDKYLSSLPIGPYIKLNLLTHLTPVTRGGGR